MTSKNLPLLSFYTGGGFLDMGFEMAGFNIVWSNEYDISISELHSAGITSWRKSKGNGLKAEIFNTKSILEIDSKDIIAEAFVSGIPKYFGIIGGPPCQDFSVYGKRGGFQGERGKLTITFYDKILELMPTFFVMENVTGLLKQKSNKEYLLKLLKRVENKYFVDFKILNSLDFGVPQFRERVFFVGINKNVLPKSKISVGLDGHWFPWPVNTKYNNSFEKYIWPDTNDYGKKPAKPTNIPLELCVESCLIEPSEYNLIPNANEYFKFHIDKNKLKCIQEGQTNRPSFKRLHRYRFSPTACYGNNEVHLHPYKNRRLSVREALRIQGVPDEYILPANSPLSKKFKMIGNGVSVPMGEALALAMKQYLNSIS